MAPSKRTGAARPTSGPLTDARIETVLIFARDFDTLLRFYRDTLGLKVGYSSAMFAELSAGPGAGISLHGGSETLSKSDGDVMIEFLVQDIDATVRALQERGVSPEPVREESFGKITHFVDPEGHRIGIEQPRQ